jgi:hypothetical protein
MSSNFKMLEVEKMLKENKNKKVKKNNINSK